MLFYSVSLTSSLGFKQFQTYPTKVAFAFRTSHMFTTFIFFNTLPAFGTDLYSELIYLTLEYTSLSPFTAGKAGMVLVTPKALYFSTCFTMQLSIFIYLILIINIIAKFTKAKLLTILIDIFSDDYVTDPAELLI